MDPEPHPSPSFQVPYLFSSGPTFSLHFFLSPKQLWNTFLSFTLLDRSNSIWLWLWKIHPFMFRQYLCILSRILVPSFALCMLLFHVSVCSGTPCSPMKTTCHFFTWFPNWWGGLLSSLGWSLNTNQSLCVPLPYRVFFHGPFPSRSQSAHSLFSCGPVVWSWGFALLSHHRLLNPSKPAFSLLINKFFLDVRISMLWINPAKNYSVPLSSGKKQRTGSVKVRKFMCWNKDSVIGKAKLCTQARRNKELIYYSPLAGRCLSISRQAGLHYALKLLRKTNTITPKFTFSLYLLQFYCWRQCKAVIHPFSHCWGSKRNWGSLDNV